MTFVMCHDALGDLDLASGLDIARCGLQEEERLFGYGIPELLRMCSVVTPNGYNLEEIS